MGEDLFAGRRIALRIAGSGMASIPANTSMIG